MSEENQNKEEVVSLEGLDLEPSPNAENSSPPPSIEPPKPSVSIAVPAAGPPPELEEFKIQTQTMSAEEPKKSKFKIDFKKHLDQIIEKSKVKAIEFKEYLIKDGRKDFVAGSKKALAVSLAFSKTVWNLPRLKKLYILIFFVGIFTLHKISQRFKMKDPLPKIGGSIVTSLDQVANAVYEYDPAQSTWEDFESTIRLPNHTVTLNQVVVNLRSSSNSPSPMAFLRLNVETSNKDAAVEVLDREKEFIDLIQRTVEALTYEDLNSIEGKNQMKIVLRKKMNDVLNRGRVKRVYIQDIIFKP